MAESKGKKTTSTGAKKAAPAAAKKPTPAAEKKAEPGTALALIPLNTKLAEIDGKPYIPFHFDLKPEGAEADDTERINLPLVKLLNALSGEITSGEYEDVQAGVFFHSLTNETMESIRLVPLNLYLERYLNSAGSLTDVVCFSRDGFGKYGIASVPYSELGIPTTVFNDPMHGELTVGNCAACPLKEITKGAQGQNVRAQCRLVKWLVCAPETLFEEMSDPAFMQQLIDPESGAVGMIISQLFVVPFSRTNLGALNQITNIGRISGSLFTNVWEITPTFKQKGTNKWWGYAVKPVRMLSTDEKILARSLYVLAKNLRPALTATQVDAPTANDIDGDADIEVN